MWFVLCCYLRARAVQTITRAVNVIAVVSYAQVIIGSKYTIVLIHSLLV